MKSHVHSEKGQVLVILVVALIGLLGFTSLAIDVGMIYSDRRYAQNVADASAIAGAQASMLLIENFGMKNYEWQCGTLTANIQDAYQKAIQRAAVNDFTIIQDDSLGTAGHDHGVRVICNQAGRYLDVMVMLSRVTSTSFVHLFYGGQVRNTVTAIARVKPGITAGNGANLVSTGPEDGNDTGGIYGSGNTFLTISGMCSRSNIEFKSNTDVTIAGGEVLYDEDFTAVGIPSPAPIPQADPCPIVHQPIPSPGDKCASADVDPYDKLQNFSGALTPGNYGDLDFSGPVTLSPGLYCINGTVKMNDTTGYIAGTGVTIYYTGTSLTINGGSDQTLAAPNSPGTPPTNNAVEDLLLYIPPTIRADVKINGKSGSTFSGTMYAPNSLWIVNGSGTVDNPVLMSSSIIGYDIILTGTSYVDMVYDSDTDFGWPAAMDVNR